MQYSGRLNTGPVTARVTEPDYDDIEAELQVEFHLTYEGPLLGASRTDTRSAHKHEIRRAFHPQLKRLWAVTEHLNQLRDPLPSSPAMVVGGSHRRREEELPKRCRQGDFSFVPLVTKDLQLTCSLDVLFLRPEPRGWVIKSGDIDNRLKTVFDALRLPVQNGSELSGIAPVEGESPLYCLLEDDSLINRVALETDMLLKPATGDELKPNDARLIIRVKIYPINPTWSTVGFLS